MLTNRNEVRIVGELASILQEKVKTAAFSKESATFLPFYDSVLDEESKSELAEIALTEEAGDKVKHLGLKRIMKLDNQGENNSLIQFRPKKSAQSDILNDY